MKSGTRKEERKNIMSDKDAEKKYIIGEINKLLRHMNEDALQKLKWKLEKVKT